MTFKLALRRPVRAQPKAGQARRNFHRSRTSGAQKGPTVQSNTPAPRLALSQLIASYHEASEHRARQSEQVPSTTTSSHAPTRVANSNVGSGVELPQAFQSDIAQHFGRPAPKMRLHFGHKAERMCSLFGAEALTFQNHTFLRQRQMPRVDDRRSRELVRHEACHVINDSSEYKWHASYVLGQQRILLGEPLDQQDIASLDDDEVEALADFCRMVLDTRPPYDPAYEAASAYLHLIGKAKGVSSLGVCSQDDDVTGYCPIPDGFSEHDMRDATNEELYDLRGQVDYAYGEGSIIASLPRMTRLWRPGVSSTQRSIDA